MTPLDAFWTVAVITGVVFLVSGLAGIVGGYIFDLINKDREE